jgi:hypothetical protein
VHTVICYVEPMNIVENNRYCFKVFFLRIISLKSSYKRKGISIRHKCMYSKSVSVSRNALTDLQYMHILISSHYVWPRSNEWHDETLLKFKFNFYCDWRSVGQPVLESGPLWGLWTNFSFPCLTITQHLLWDQGKPLRSWPVAEPSGYKLNSSLQSGIKYASRNIT